MLGLVGACVFGVLLTGKEILNPVGTELTKQAAQADRKATLVAQDATHTSEALDAQETAVPRLQTLDAQHWQATQAADEFQAAQDARQRERDKQQLKDTVDAATQVGLAGAALVAVGALVFLFVQVGRWLGADAVRKEHEAQARMLVEQRRLEELKASAGQRAYRPANGSGPAKVEPVIKGSNGQNVKIPGYVK